MQFRYAYLHGFASGSRSRKGTLLKGAFEARGTPFETPDLNNPSFDRITISGSLEAVNSLDRKALPLGAPWRFVGSSMGGYLAAGWAAAHPTRVNRLVLLCPGFDMAERWPLLVGEDDWRRWEEDGSLMLPDGAGEPTPVHWGFIEDGRRHPRAPAVPCPTLIIHGRQDDVVPIESSRKYAEAHDRVDLVEVDDGHELANSAERILEEVMTFFGMNQSNL